MELELPKTVRFLKFKIRKAFCQPNSQWLAEIGLVQWLRHVGSRWTHRLGSSIEVNTIESTDPLSRFDIYRTNSWWSYGCMLRTQCVNVKANDYGSVDSIVFAQIESAHDWNRHELADSVGYPQSLRPPKNSPSTYNKASRAPSPLNFWTIFSGSTFLRSKFFGPNFSWPQFFGISFLAIFFGEKFFLPVFLRETSTFPSLTFAHGTEYGAQYFAFKDKKNKVLDTLL